MQGTPGVEVLLDGRQQILAGANLGQVVGRVDPAVLQGFVGGHSLLRVDGQAAVDEVAGFLGDTAPILERGEGVIGREDGLHFF